jgi:hypothetical protein
VTDNVDPLDGEVVENAGDISGEVEQAVGVDCLRLVAVPEAAQVGSDRPVAGLDQSADLVTPQGVRIGPAVQQQHRRIACIAGHGDFDGDVVGGDAHHHPTATRSPSTGLPDPVQGRDIAAAPPTRR